MALSTRQPFAELGTPRLQTLSSAKNRQNAIAPTFSSSLKPTPTSTGKRQRAVSSFEEDDAENVDPSIFNSPSKRSKTSDAGFVKPSTFSLVSTPASVAKASPALSTSSSLPTARRPFASPKSTSSTPISHSRGSPKHKRIGLLSKRRVSSSPFRRVDPPSFHSSPSLPFSIDAALSGTIPNYTPTPKTTAPATPSHATVLEESMPKSWFFDIHEDTPEQEAANLMEHSASVLDISSDDDSETKRRNDEHERGKENIPPPDFLATLAQSQVSADRMVEEGVAVSAEPVKRPRMKKLAQDAMDEDRRPLGDLPAADYYGEGLDANSYVTVDATIEKPSGLSKEFEFSCPPTPEKQAVDESQPEPQPEEVKVDAEVPTKQEEEIQIYSDEAAATGVPQTESAVEVATEAVEPVSAVA